MKKKLMMVAVLLGALSLGACVDDNESQSVTDLRGAKAAQLNALAELYSKQAEAAAAAAAAEADLKAAQAEYERAKAAAEQADADWTQEQIRQAQEEFKLKLAALEAQYESKIAEYNALKQYYENELWSHQDTQTTTIYNAYAGALSQVNALTQTKFEQQILKAQTEAQTITAEESLKQSVSALNTERAQKERELAKLTEMKEMQPSKDEYLAMLDDLEKEAYDILNNQRPDAQVKKDEAQKTYETALEAFEDGTYKFLEAVNTLEDLARNPDIAAYAYFTTSEWVEFAEDEREAFYDKWQTYAEGNFSLYKQILKPNSEIESAKLQFERAFEQALKNKEIEIKAKTGTAWEVDDNDNIIWDNDYQTWNPTVNGAKSEQAYYDQQIANANKNIAGWEEDLKEEGANKEQLNQWIENEKNNIDNYTDRKEDAAVRQLQAEEALAQLNEEKAEIVAKQKTYNETLPILSDAAAQKEYEDAIAALETPAVAYVAAQDELKPFNVQLEDMGFATYVTNGQPQPQTNGNGQYQYIKNLLDGIYDVESLINECNTRIAQIDAILSTSGLGELVTLTTYYQSIYNPVTGQYENVQVEYYVFTGNGYGITLENALALIDARIAQLDEQIKIQQALADKYEAELKALLNLTDEETPAA